MFLILSRMRAPLLGLIAVYAISGALAAGRPVASLLPPGNIKARFYVPETSLGAIALGEAVFGVVMVVAFPRLVAAEHRTGFSRDVLSSGVPELDSLLGGGLQRGQHGWQHFHAHHFAGGYAHRAAHAFAEAARAAFERCGHAVHGFGAVAQGECGLSGQKASLRSREQGGAQRGFQQRHMPAHGGLREAQRARCA